jgi:hypothetical protein
MITRTGMAFVLSVLMLGMVAQGNARKLTVDDAKRIEQQVALDQGWTKLPGFGVEGDVTDEDRYYPGFYTLFLIWANPKPGSVVVGYLSVDDRTGDAWNANLCESYDSPALEGLKQKIRRDAGLSPTAYARIRRRGPMCDANWLGRLTTGDMESIVLEYAKENGFSKRSHFAIQDQGDEGSYSDFRTLAMFWDEPGRSAQRQTQLLVDKNTGDLWESFDCIDHESPGLDQLKREIRARRHLTETGYRKVRQDSPYCALLGREPKATGARP